MVEETIKPCPICGATARLHQAGETYWIECVPPGRVVPGQCVAVLGPRGDTPDAAITAWNALSDATTLARAVERLAEAWIGKSTSNMIELSRTPEQTYDADCVEYIGGAMRRASGSGATIAAALIALAEQIEDTP